MTAQKFDEKKTDRVVFETDDIKLANEIRKHIIFTCSPRPCVYVIKRHNEEKVSIVVASEIGTFLGEKRFNELALAVENFVSSSTTMTQRVMSQ